MPQSAIWSYFTLRILLLLFYSVWHEHISSHLKLSIFMLKRHFKDQLFLLLCHWDVPMPIQQKCSFHFHKRDENTISPEICTFQVLLINLHFKECKGFIWKKKKHKTKQKKKKKKKKKKKRRRRRKMTIKEEIVPCGLLYSSDDTKAEFNNCFIIHSKIECIENL